MRGRIGGLICLAALVLGPGFRATSQQMSGERSPIEIQQKLPESLTPGQPVPIEILIRNSGGERVENVTALATLTEGWRVLDAEPISEREARALRWPLGAMEAGAERLLHLRVSATADGRAPGELRSTVKVTYQASVQRSAVATVHRPVLSMQLSVPDAVPVGEPASVVIAIANNGGSPAEGVLLQTVLPTGLSHPGGNDLESEVGTIQPGETKRVTLAVTPTRAGEFRHRIRVLLHGESAVEQESCITTQDLKIAVTANGPTLLYTDWTGSFEVALRNTDTRPVENVTVVVSLPPGLAVVRSSDDGVYEARDHLLRWHASALKPGETRTLLWSGVARKVGDQECNIQVSSGARASKTASWRTAVMAKVQFSGWIER
jgi:uncharacterized repeat protein (TIGR01451 family)